MLYRNCPNTEYVMATQFDEKTGERVPLNDRVLYKGLSISVRELEDSLYALFISKYGKDTEKSFYSWADHNPDLIVNLLDQIIYCSYIKDNTQYRKCDEWEWANKVYSPLAYQQIITRFPYYKNRFYKTEVSENDTIIQAFNDSFESISLEDFSNNYFAEEQERT